MKQCRGTILLPLSLALIALAFIGLSASAMGGPPGRDGDQAAALNSAASTTLYAATDAYVNQNAPNTSYGSATNLSVSKDEFLQETRTLVRFDLSSLPAGSIINSASLQLWLRSADFGSPVLKVRRVSEAWTTSVTWNTQPNVINVDYASTTVISPSLSYYVPWNVTTLVDKWVNPSD